MAGEISAGRREHGERRAPVVIKQRTGMQALAPDGVASLTLEEVAAAVGVAAIIENQRQLIKPPELVEELVAFAHRLHRALEHASGDVVSFEVSAREQQVMTFLIAQTRARRELSWRVRHVCEDCGAASLSNPAYDKVRDRNRKILALSRMGGMALSPRGVTPFFMISSLMAFAKLDPDYVCRSCNGMRDDESIVVFCPSCKALHTEAILDRCRCGYVFRDPQEVRELWADRALVLPTAGGCMADLELPGAVQAFAYAPRAEMAVACLDDGSARGWYVACGEDACMDRSPTEVWTTKAARGSTCALSADARVMALASTGGVGSLFEVKVLDGRNGKVKGKAQRKGDGQLTAVAVDPQGRQIAVATNVVDLFQLPGAGWKATIKMGRGWMSAPNRLSFSPDGSQLASDGSASLWVWDVPTGDVIAKLPKVADSEVVSWSRDGSELIDAGLKKVTVQEPEARRMRVEIELPNKASSVAAGEAGLLAVGGDDGRVRVFGTEDGAEQWAFRAGHAPVRGLAFLAPDGLLVACGRRLQIWAC